MPLRLSIFCLAAFGTGFTAFVAIGFQPEDNVCIRMQGPLACQEEEINDKCIAAVQGP